MLMYLSKSKYTSIYIIFAFSINAIYFIPIVTRVNLLLKSIQSAEACELKSIGICAD
jgi:hypothetical protein